MEEKNGKLTFCFRIENIIKDVFGVGTMKFTRKNNEVIFQKMEFKRKYIAVHQSSKKRQKENY